MSPYDDGYVSFIYVCMYVCMCLSHLLIFVAHLPTAHLAFVYLLLLLLLPSISLCLLPCPLLQMYLLSTRCSQSRLPAISSGAY